MATRAPAPQPVPQKARPPRSAGRPPEAGMPVVRLVLAVLLLLTTAAAIAIFGLRYLNTGEVRVPDLSGQNLETAAFTLERLDLEARPFIQHSADLPVGSVVTQSPAPGTLVRRGRGVSLGVNSPRESVAAPDLVGTPHQGAARALEAAGLALGQTSYVYSAAPVGQIVSQEPQAGASVPAGAAMNVAVSRGFQATQREVPRVIGLSVADARRQLEAAGFANVEAVVSAVSRSGVSAVRAQSPEPGQVVLDTLPVTLFYNLADERVVEIPDLRGMSVAQAQLRLRGLGLTPAWISEENDPDRPSGVLEVRPEGWTVRGSPVVLVVNRSGMSPAEEDALATSLLGEEVDASFADEAASAEAPLPPSEAVAEGPGRTVRIDYPVEELFTNRTYRFLVLVDDDEGQRTAHEQNVRPGDRVQTSITVFGDAEVSFYLDDQWVFTWFP